MKDILFDVLIDIPGLLEDLDNLRLCTDEGTVASMRQDLMQKCWDCDEQLLSWFSFLCADRDFCDFPLPQTQDGIVSVVEFARLEGMVLFWATCLVLYSTLRRPEVSSELTSLPERTHPQQYLGKLVEAIPLLLRPSAGLYGQDAAALPLALALTYTSGTASSSKEHMLLMQNLDKMQGEVVAGLRVMVKSLSP
jgi:hypothetical protein